MDSRRCSAALGFTLLIGCVIGIVILIYNSGSSRRSLDSLGSSSSPVQHSNHHHHHHQQQHAKTVVGGKAAGGGGVSSSKSLQDGFANDPNYQSSQPTMQEVSEFAELHRLLSSKSKHAASSGNTGNSGNNGKGNPVNVGMKKTNGSTASSMSSSSSATSSVKASITAVNYSSVPKTSSFHPQSGSGGGSMTSTSLSTNSSSPRRNPTLTTSSVNRRQEVAVNHQQHNSQQNNHNNNQKPYPGHQSPPPFPTVLRPTTTQMMVASSGERQGLAPPREKNARRGSGGGLAHNDLYTTSWHPSMVAPAGGGIPVVPNHPYHHRHHLYNHPQHPHRAHINNPQPPQSSSPAKINVTGKKGTDYPLNQNGAAAPVRKQYQHEYHHYGQDDEKEDRHKEDGDFIQLDDDDYEDDVSGNLGNLKKEEEWDGDNDVADDHEEDEEEDEEEEEDEANNGSDPAFLMEPKNLAADLETLFSLANHLYTSPASLLSTFSAYAKTNSTKKTDSSTSISGLPAAFQGFLKVINETIQRGNNSKLLVQLNDMYQGREARMSRAPDGNNRNKNANQTSEMETASSDALKNVGNASQQSPYEKSLTAFVFMSFGVFLLNQIHSFVQKTATDHLKHHTFMSNNNNTLAVGEGRAIPWAEDGPFTWYSPKGDMVMTTEASSLDILFQPPTEPPLHNNSTNSTFEDHLSPDSASGRSNDHHNVELDGKGYMNNMFRALLNIANAYTKESPSVDCIWSLYCQDLDETAHRRGLYGVAARINSVGLRLIMKQIPPALTFDVILRSLVGWDGLPCRKMFPECSVGNGTISMVNGQEDNTVVGGEHVATNALKTGRQTHI